MNNVFLNNNNKTQIIKDEDGNNIDAINPNTINKSAIGINLLGENLNTYANGLNENFIKIIQNFYGNNPPLKPLKGQKWLSKNDNMMYIWDGYTWKQLEENKIFDIKMIVREIDSKEILIDDSVFKLGIENISIYDQDMNKIIFTFDPNNSERIFIKSPNIKLIYIIIFHPNDKVSNPYFNKKMELISEINSQTQFDISEIMKGNVKSNISVKVNDDLITFNDFYIENNVLNLNGKIFNIKKNDVIKVWKYGGSLKKYNAELKIEFDEMTDVIRIPKFFEKIRSIKIIDKVNKSLIMPISVEDKINYYEILIMDKKKISAEIDINII
jgi:hypothetical protein